MAEVTDRVASALLRSRLLEIVNEYMFVQQLVWALETHLKGRKERHNDSIPGRGSRASQGCVPVVVL
jgi:hypothetical protein